MTVAAFLDRDGVINFDHGYVSCWDQFEFIPGVPEALHGLAQAGYQLVIVSNQSGIGRGFYTEADLRKLNRQINDYLKTAFDIQMAGFYHCPHHPTEAQGEFLVQCECRKPAPGMILQASLDLGIDVSASLLVGDKDSDIQAGRRAGVGRLFRVSPSSACDAGDSDCESISALPDVLTRL
jgi:D-glycero-D-manno-heptose 1,7-bisphosphate phosphatase